MYAEAPGQAVGRGEPTIEVVTARSVRALVSGRVQGVGYRASCASVARQLGLSGYVRNCEDGRVEVVAHGATEVVAALLAWCRQGPPGAVVGEVAEVPLEGRPAPGAGDGAGGAPGGGAGFAIR